MKIILIILIVFHKMIKYLICKSFVRETSLKYKSLSVSGNGIKDYSRVCVNHFTQVLFSFRGFQSGFLFSIKTISNSRNPISFPITIRRGEREGIIIHPMANNTNSGE